MATSKPISSISFNTENFLKSKLDELVEANIVTFYAYIFHKAEPKASNDTKKRHCHFYLELNKRVDTLELKMLFNETEEGSDKPRGCLPFVNSKFDDWYLYAIHDPTYLDTKGMTRKYAYKKSKIKTSSKDYLEEKVNHISIASNNVYFEIKGYIERGYGFKQYSIAKNIPPIQLNAYRSAWDMVVERYFTDC